MAFRCRTHRRPPDFAPSSETPGGYVGQAVLERVVGVVDACNYAASGGEPLWRVSRHPREFVLACKKGQPLRATGGSRELPIASQFYGRIRTNRNALGKNTRWDIRGSRPLRYF